MSQEVEPPRSPFGLIKRILFGAPIATSRAHHERLSRFFGLPVFASDAISSMAYATEEILLVLVLAGTVAVPAVTGISIAIAALVGIVIFSYVRTIYAYPMGGGGYRVSSDNLGSKAGRVAGGALLIDYVLTVAVSVSSGVLAIVSAFPVLTPYMVHLGIVATLLVAWINLRGTRESGVVFAIPTYTFIILISILIIGGIFRVFLGATPHTASHLPTSAPVEAFGLWILLRGFSAGCTALTGIEAIADGAGAFKAPEPKNASLTLITLGIILATLFVGTSWLSHQFGIVPLAVGTEGYKTVVAQIAERVFGQGPLFYLVQFTTMAILVLAANTAFADFPRLASFMAKDGYLPRQLANIGDRLVFQNGIILLAVAACLLIFAFHGDTHKLIPLYAVGVFTSFTLSQAGMVVRQVRQKSAKWGIVASFTGAITTGIVMVIILVTKFHAGAWIVVIAEAFLLMFFYFVRKHYDYLARRLNIGPEDHVLPVTGTVLLLVPPRIHKGILHAIAYARTISSDCRAIHITDDPKSTDEMKRQWDKFGGQIPLVILESPYRSLVDPLLAYIDEAVSEEPGHILTVVVPQAVAKHWWQTILHNNAATPIKLALASRKNVVVTNVRYFLE
ncbi:MAG TPA: APC family permease [Fimbriimonadales bacterium]|nr:APC family permease [Fimbriimonadales bacterium]